MAASIYMILGRVILLTDGDSHSLVRRRWITKTFVTGDVISLQMQSTGMHTSGILPLQFHIKIKH